MNIAHGVEQARHLLLSRANYPGVRMPGGRDAKGSGQIQVPFSFRVPDMYSPGAFPNNGPTAFRIQMRDIPRFKLAEEIKDLFRRQAPFAGCHLLGGTWQRLIRGVKGGSSPAADCSLFPG